MADIIKTNLECLGIAYVSCRVDPVEMAAEHPLMQRLANDHTIGPEEAIDMFEHLGDEFMLDPDQLQSAWQICHDEIWGSSNG